MLKQSVCWRCGVLLCSLVLLAVSEARPQDEKATTRSGAGKGKAADETPAPEAVELLRVSVRSFLKKHTPDKDGKLSWKEVQAQFDRFDRDKDDFLDRKELADAIIDLSGNKDVKADQYVIAFMREFDVNKDGKLSRKEAKVLFEGADMDKDSVLDENEIVAAASRLLPSQKAGTPSQPPPPPPRTDKPETTTPRTAPPAKPRRLVRLLGVRVVLGRGDALGQVVDVVTDEEGRVAYVVVGDADTLVAVPWGAVRYSGEDRGFAVTAQVTRARLQEVSFTKSRYPDFASETWVRNARAVWGEQALGGRPERGGTQGRQPGAAGTQDRPPGQKPPGQKPPDRTPQDRPPPRKLPPKERPERLPVQR
jgi:hypothetical protein